MELILDGIKIQIADINYYVPENNITYLEIFLLEKADNDFRTVIKKKYDLIQVENNLEFKNMYFYSCSTMNNNIVLTFIDNEELSNELSITEIYQIHDSLKELISLLKNKEIPKTYNNFLQKLTEKNYDSIEVNKYGGYTMLNEDWINDFAIWLKDKKVLEIGAGVGALAAELQKRDIDIIPIDNRSWDRFGWNSQDYNFNWTEILIEDYFANASKYKDRDIIILSYPIQGEYSYNILQFIRQMNPNSKIIFIGPFRNDYVTDDFINSVEFIEDEAFQKISKKYKYWTGHDYMQSQLLLLK